MMARIKLPQGHVSILSPAFKYTRSGNTDVRRTFARVRRQQAEAEAKRRETHVVSFIRKEKP